MTNKCQKYAKDLQPLAEIGRLAVEWWSKPVPQLSANLASHLRPAIYAYLAAQREKEGI